MQVELTKRDLIRLVTSVEPNLYEDMYFKYNDLGEQRGGLLNEWKWNKDALEQLEEQQLYDIYVDCSKWINEQENYIKSLTNK